MDQADHQGVWLTEPRVRHPLADRLEVGRLIDRLPSGDSAQVLQQVTQWLGELIDLPDCPLQHTYEIIDLLDRIAKNHQVRLVPDYLETSRMRKLSESRLWKTSFDFWRSLGDAYLKVLERYQTSGDGAKDFRPVVPVVIGRILRTLGVQLKWTLLRYAFVEDRIWRDLGQTYLLADGWGFANRRCTLYPGRHGESSAQEEMLKALMLSVSAPDALSPLQLHLAERLVALLSDRFALHETQGPGCTFSFDLSMHKAPTRARRTHATAPMLRYFGQGTATEGLRVWTEQVRHLGKLPVDLGLGEAYDPGLVRSVTEHLARCWSDLPVARRSKRQAVVMRLTVVPGFAETLQWLQVRRGASQDPVNANTWESWVVYDGSDGGCGALIPSNPSDWLHVGALVGIRSDSGTEDRVGILRRISPDPEGQIRVGIEYIGEQAAPVVLLPVPPKGVTPNPKNGKPAILVSRRPDPQGMIELILRPDAFAYAKQLQMVLFGRTYLITPEENVEHCKDYRRERFRLLSVE
jgi:hypothetical protein